MDILTPKQLELLKLQVRSFLKGLEEQNIRLLELDEQYKLILKNVETYNWSCSAIKTQCHGDKAYLSSLIDVYEIYIHIGY